MIENKVPPIEVIVPKHIFKALEELKIKITEAALAEENFKKALKQWQIQHA